MDKYLNGPKSLYNRWKLMRARCNNKWSHDYKNYGGRGITICKEWDNYANFLNWSLQNGYSEELFLDRIDNNKGYGPDNCRWATRKQNNNNTRRTHYITAFNETKTLYEWKEDKRCKVTYETLYYRVVLAKWNPEIAIKLEKYPTESKRKSNSG